MNANKYKTAIAYACWIALDAGTPLKRSKLFKSIWLADLENFIQTGDSVSGDRIVRKRYGPVNKNIIKILDEATNEGLIKERKIEDVSFMSYEYTVENKPTIEGVLTSQEVSNISSAVTRLNPLSARQVSAWTHTFDAWKNKNDGDEIHLAEFILGESIKPTEEDFKWAEAILA